MRYSRKCYQHPVLPSSLRTQVSRILQAPLHLRGVSARWQQTPAQWSVGGSHLRHFLAWLFILQHIPQHHLPGFSHLLHLDESRLTLKSFSGEAPGEANQVLSHTGSLLARETTGCREMRAYVFWKHDRNLGLFVTVVSHKGSVGTKRILVYSSPEFRINRKMIIKMRGFAHGSGVGEHGRGVWPWQWVLLCDFLELDFPMSSKTTLYLFRVLPHRCDPIEISQCSS